jgi:2-polyprenyl-6-methoxyphenol hydroxylase-like FAD-dependent oxidoreductase
MSTHLVQAAGMDVLDRIGVGDRVRAAAPASRTFRFSLDESVAVSRNDEGRYAYCVRRSVIDPWLQEAAEEAGATLLDKHRVVDLLRDGERVTGVVARGPSGPVSFHADLVVGADGAHSTVAKLAGVEEYLVSESTRAGYWGYFPAPAVWTEDWDAILEHKGNDLRYGFRTDGDLVTMVYTAPMEELRSWGRDHKEKFVQALAGSEQTRRLVEGKAPIGNVMGLMKSRYFYRRPVGPGFALAGDAGHFKDFVTGLGMADAFLDAQRLARTIVDGRPEAFELFWRERDVETMPLHFDAIAQGKVGFNDPFNRWVIQRVGKDPEITKRVTKMLDRKLDPAEMVPMRTMLAWMGAALVRGRFDVLSGFMKAGKHLGGEAKELAARRALHERAKAALAAAEAPSGARPTELPRSAQHVVAA